MREHGIPGEWLIVCDQCGFTHYQSDTKKQWNKYQVCIKCYEPMPAAYKVLPAMVDKETVPFARPDITYPEQTVTIDGHMTAEEWLNLPTLPSPL
jgi:hypothetical protein